MTPRVEMSVDLNALSYNFSVIRDLVGPDVAIMPMVKANAYGHGLADVAQQLTKADAFGVATLPEAICLRKGGIKQAIFVMCGFREPQELELFSELQLTAVIHHKDQIDWLLQAPLENPIAVWLKLDTGMHRLGVSIEQFEQAYQCLNASSKVSQPIGLMTHLANADADTAFTQQQLAIFDRYTGHVNNPKSVANSAGIINFKASHHQLVRPGLMLYGVSPFADKTGKELGLKQAMTLSSRLVSYKHIKKGAEVGYGCNWCADKDLVLGIVTAGYGDGYPRHAKNGTPVLIAGIECPIVGHVSMDMLAVDVSAVKQPYIGQHVILWGSDLPIERIALSADTIAYELFCQLTGRVTKKLMPCQGAMSVE
ncbi:MAG: alanine racemase [Coxiella sp. (in: Bacteria)]|nr:MAG: alanine racemase [Coxiella sp. (in: g-proteobacteria)]